MDLFSAIAIFSWADMNSLFTCSWGGAALLRSLTSLIASSLNSRLNLRLSMTYLRLMKHPNWVSIKPTAHPTIISFFAGFFLIGTEVVASEDERRVLHRSPR
jgi:hypothetical protein